MGRASDSGQSWQSCRRLSSSSWAAAHATLASSAASPRKDLLFPASASLASARTLLYAPATNGVIMWAKDQPRRGSASLGAASFPDFSLVVIVYSYLIRAKQKGFTVPAPQGGTARPRRCFVPSSLLFRVRG
jgi:hypothetical protein